MSPPAPECSRLVALAQLSARPFRQRIEATAEERERLSRRFDFISLGRLVAEGELRRQSPQGVLLEAGFAAEVRPGLAGTPRPVCGAGSDPFSPGFCPAARA